MRDSEEPIFSSSGVGKVHLGTDTNGLTHSLVTTNAAQSAFNQLPNLIHGEEDEVYGDGAYRSESDRRCFQEVKVRYA